MSRKSLFYLFLVFALSTLSTWHFSKKRQKHLKYTASRISKLLSQCNLHVMIEHCVRKDTFVCDEAIRDRQWRQGLPYGGK